MISLDQYISSNLNESIGNSILDIVKKYKKYIQRRRDTWERVVSQDEFNAIWSLKDDDSSWSGIGKPVPVNPGHKLKGPFINFRMEDEEDPKITIYLDEEFEFEDWDSNGIEFGLVDGDAQATVGPVFVMNNEKDVWDDTIYAVELSNSFAKKIFNLIK